jgi:hypothetical protein
MQQLAGRLRGLGPYAAIALLVPGGSLIAVALWTLNHRRARVAPPVWRMLIVVAVLGASISLRSST